MLKKINIKAIIALAVILSVSLVFVSLARSSSSEKEDNDKIQATIYKSPTCSCCLGHAAYLNKNDFVVETHIEKDIASIKEKYNIPYDMQSCHTAIIGDYFVEGHVPIEAIEKLLTEKPDIDGITLPGMPAGSPGMPGTKSEDFVIYSLKNGEVGEFMRI